MNTDTRKRRAANTRQYNWVLEDIVCAIRISGFGASTPKPKLLFGIA
ncbi:MAG: hypothetical protein R2860_12060 [Desulfobacterales bacterium]